MAKVDEAGREAEFAVMTSLLDMERSLEELRSYGEKNNQKLKLQNVKMKPKSDGHGDADWKLSND